MTLNTDELGNLIDSFNKHVQLAEGVDLSSAPRETILRSLVESQIDVHLELLKYKRDQGRENDLDIGGPGRRM